MEENEKDLPEEAVTETVSTAIEEAADDAAGADGRAENSENADATELRQLGREIAEGLRGVIGEEIERRLRGSDETPACGGEGELSRLLRDPRFLRLLSERLFTDRSAPLTDAAPVLRRRGARPLPASAPSAPKTLDDARAAARKYFRID